MSDSETRRALERSVRALIPDEVTAPAKMLNRRPDSASAGVSGLLTGYAWGWMRGRRARRAKKKSSS
jgi:hypothetical protein